MAKVGPENIDKNGCANIDVGGKRNDIQTGQKYEDPHESCFVKDLCVFHHTAFCRLAKASPGGKRAETHSEI